ncbi:MAG: hypothetical protein RR980_02040 [Mucinivorans sp.]
MDNKLQELTEKLYAEGLEKGKAEGQKILSQAKAEAAAIVEAAKEQAAKIEAQAQKEAQSLARNTAADVRMASLQTISVLRSEIETFVVAQLAHAQVQAAFADGSLTRDLIVKAVEAFSPSSDNGVQVIVPEDYMNEARAAVLSKLDQGVEIVFDGKTRVPFRIAPSEGGYYVSFSDSDFENLLRGSLRAGVSKLLFDK